MVKCTSFSITGTFMSIPNVRDNAWRFYVIISNNVKFMFHFRLLLGKLGVDSIFVAK